MLLCCLNVITQMYAKKIGGEEWINVLHRMMGEFVQLIVEPVLHDCQPDHAKERNLGRWVPCETLALRS